MLEADKSLPIIVSDLVFSQMLFPFSENKQKFQLPKFQFKKLPFRRRREYFQPLEVRPLIDKSVRESLFHFMLFAPQLRADIINLNGRYNALVPACQNMPNHKFTQHLS